MHDKLLHMIYYKDDLETKREDVAPEEQFIQVSALQLEEGSTFRPHKHIWKEAPEPEVIAQESWCIMKGRVKAHFYDLDDSLIGEYELNEGDISLTIISRGANPHQINFSPSLPVYPPNLENPGLLVHAYIIYFSVFLLTFTASLPVSSSVTVTLLSRSFISP